MPRSPFTDDWHAMQTSQFTYIMRTGDAQQRAAAIHVMRQTGYSEAQIRALYIDATMHADDVPPDFVPDVDVIETQREAQHPSDCLCAHCRTPNTPHGS